MSSSSTIKTLFPGISNTSSYPPHKGSGASRDSNPNDGWYLASLNTSLTINGHRPSRPCRSTEPTFISPRRNTMSDHRVARSPSKRPTVMHCWTTWQRQSRKSGTCCAHDRRSCHSGTALAVVVAAIWKSKPAYQIGILASSRLDRKPKSRSMHSILPATAVFTARPVAFPAAPLSTTGASPARQHQPVTLRLRARNARHCRNQDRIPPDHWLSCLAAHSAQAGSPAREMTATMTIAPPSRSSIHDLA